MQQRLQHTFETTTTKSLFYGIKMKDLGADSGHSFCNHMFHSSPHATKR